MRAPGPREKIAQPDGMPTPTMAAWMRDITARDTTETDRVAALIAKLIEDDVLPEGWPDV